MVVLSKSSAVLQSKSGLFDMVASSDPVSLQWKTPLHAPVLGVSGKMMFQPQSLFPWWLG